MLKKVTLEVLGSYDCLTIRAIKLLLRSVHLKRMEIAEEILQIFLTKSVPFSVSFSLYLSLFKSKYVQ